MGGGSGVIGRRRPAPARQPLEAVEDAGSKFENVAIVLLCVNTTMAESLIATADDKDRRSGGLATAAATEVVRKWVPNRGGKGIGLGVFFVEIGGGV